ncbi:MAG: hypothetical protein GX091_11200 [Peptococcaceae bacterium]|nr:hypothetical protein [Peptococcaceae bacterium]
MNKLFILIITLAMVFSIAACGKSDTTGSSLQSGEKTGQEEIAQAEQQNQQKQTEQSKDSAEVGGGQKMVNQSFGAFKEVRT